MTVEDDLALPTAALLATVLSTCEQCGEETFIWNGGEYNRAQSMILTAGSEGLWELSRGHAEHACTEAD